MDKIVIQGGKALNGEVSTSGSKNAGLPLLFATLLAKGTHRFHNVPNLVDINSTCFLLEELGCKVERDGNSLSVRVGELSSTKAQYDIVRKMRASVLCMGPLLARSREATVSMPGGCAIGARPINLHLEAFKALGAKVDIEEGYVHAMADQLVGAQILFDIASVGATENIMMAASMAEGKTIIENAAKEPEIVNLGEYLNRMGAKVKGHGTGIIEIEGVKELSAAEIDVIPDRIEAGTLLLAGAITGGDVKVTHCIPKHFEPLISKLKESGFQVEEGENWVRVLPSSCWNAVDINTQVYPGFPTDLQAQFMALMCFAKGSSVISENIFENRFMHVQELVRLGADIRPQTRVAIVRGKETLKGAPVMATDLRASASLVLAGLAAQGKTEVKRIYHLDRGYDSLEKKLHSLGADIQRVKDN